MKTQALRKPVAIVSGLGFCMILAVMWMAGDSRAAPLASEASDQTNAVVVVDKSNAAEGFDLRLLVHRPDLAPMQPAQAGRD